MTTNQAGSCYGGLDVSMNETHLCVLDADGAVVLEGKTTSTPEAITNALRERPNLERVVFETGRMAPMLYHGLCERGVPAVCIESRQAHHTLRAIKANKTDERRRARPCPARPDRLLQADPRQVASRARRASADRRQEEAGRPARDNREPDPRSRRRVRRGSSPLAHPGLQGAGFGAGRGRARSRVRHARADRRARRDPVGHQLDRSRCAGHDAIIASMPAAHDRPGRWSGSTALAFASVVDDPTRFRRSREVGAHLGLTPRRHQSGENDRSGPISRRGDTRVRTLLYEAANVLLTRTKADLRLKSWALGVAARGSARKARVVPARRPAVIRPAMLRDGTEFQAA